jgi:hypothetical protein
VLTGRGLWKYRDRGPSAFLALTIYPAMWYIPC